MKVIRERLVVLLLIFEYIYYHLTEARDLEIYIGGWIVVYLAFILFTAFNVQSKPYSAGNVGNNFTYLAIDKIEKLFGKPKHDEMVQDISILGTFVFLFVINLTLYLIWYVV